MESRLQYERYLQPCTPALCSVCRLLQAPGQQSCRMLSALQLSAAARRQPALLYRGGIASHLLLPMLWLGCRSSAVSG